ncbi:DMT family transporter [Bdellovibrio bacteriovorus]|uniref:DMT family transporter n=1 Tax=Bdellovibrio bacteriovorus TaxID=959 RepID=UPI0035A99A2B
MTKNRAALELIFAGTLWGFGFVATVWALRAFTPTETLVYRFIIASVFGEILYILFRGVNFTTIREELLRALPAGLLLGGMLLLQTIGLQFTTATKSGFLTSLYVIIVPLFNAWFFKAATGWKNYALVALALIGTFILMDANLQGLNVGDIWTIGCSVIAALHIIYIGRISNRVGNAFRFNNFQSIWCLILLTPLLLTQDKVTTSSEHWQPWIGVLCLGIGSSIIAFYLQIRTQKILSDSTASMLFLLESPFAAIFGYIILSERLTLFQMSGALMILVASVIQILLEPASKTTGTKPQ